MTARIYRPARTAMQSGTAKTERWLLEYEPEAPRQIERRRDASPGRRPIHLEVGDRHGFVGEAQSWLEAAVAGQTEDDRAETQRTGPHGFSLELVIGRAGSSGRVDGGHSQPIEPRLGGERPDDGGTFEFLGSRGPVRDQLAVAIEQRRHQGAEFRPGVHRLRDGDDPQSCR